MSSFRKIKLKEPISCLCGSEISFMEMGHGRTPYIIYCQGCKLDLYKFFPSGVGWSQRDQDAVNGFKDFINLLELFKENRIKPTPEMIAEYWYREAKGWGHNPF